MFWDSFWVRLRPQVYSWQSGGIWLQRLVLRSCQATQFLGSQIHSLVLTRGWPPSWWFWWPVRWTTRVSHLQDCWWASLLPPSPSPWDKMLGPVWTRQWIWCQGKQIEPWYQPILTIDHFVKGCVSNIQTVMVTFWKRRKLLDDTVPCSLSWIYHSCVHLLSDDWETWSDKQKRWKAAKITTLSLLGPRRYKQILMRLFTNKVWNES